MSDITPEDEAIVAAMIKARELGVKMLASDCEAILDVAKSNDFMPCGHHKSLFLYSAETGFPLYCEYCDAISRKNDAEKMESLLRQQLEIAVEALELISSPSQTTNLLWWQRDAQQALAQIRELEK